MTQKQRTVYEFVRSHIQGRGYPPTVREIGSELGILWPAARGHLKALEKKGLIKMNPSVSRGIDVASFRPSEGRSVPVAGRIRAGRPILATEDIESHLFVDKTLFRSEDSFALRVAGDSMKEAGIFDGDYVIVKPQRTIKSGEIGIALVDGEATVKRIMIKGSRIVLKPENKSMEPVSHPAGRVSILGRVIGVIRKI